MLTPAALARFQSSIERRGIDECWEWNGRKAKEGYGLFGIKKEEYIATRIAYMLATGRDPASLMVCHSCDNPPCCNPKHLWLGTRTENFWDKMRKNRHAKGSKMSPLTEEQVVAIMRDTRLQRIVAAEYGVSRSTISRIRLQNGWWHIPEKADGAMIRKVNVEASVRGEGNARAKLTRAQVLAIRADERRHMEIGKDYGIARSTVSAIKSGRLWRWMNE